MSNRPAIADESDQPSLSDSIANSLVPPLERTIHVNISTNFSDLMLNPSKAVWEPAQSIISSILQKEQYTDLEGNKSNHGDLKSVVLHHVQMNNGSSTFPCPLGVRMSGIEENVYSSTAQRFAAILPDRSSGISRVLDQQDKSETHKFADKFPGFTASNIETHKVYKMPEQGVVFAREDHPCITAIKENQNVLQMGHFEPLKQDGTQGLYSISTEMWDHVMPHVKEQVANQVRTCDMTGFKVQLMPMDGSSWSDVRNSTVKSEIGAIRRNFGRKLAAAQDSDAKEELTTAMNAHIAEMEDSVDTSPIKASFDLNLRYKFLA